MIVSAKQPALEAHTVGDNIDDKFSEHNVEVVLQDAAGYNSVSTKERPLEATKIYVFVYRECVSDAEAFGETIKSHIAKNARKMGLNATMEEPAPPSTGRSAELQEYAFSVTLSQQE